MWYMYLNMNSGSRLFYASAGDSLGSQTDWTGEQGFNWNRVAVESIICYLPRAYPSMLYQTAIWPADWTRQHVIGWCEKESRPAGSVSWGGQVEG